ncbi:hypothetical protein [Sphingomonas sp.]|jgi:hypothetical protein|uniref:hypothetical protein n=1 Tax=Sphingomonas sp. TaxID=28214 RepID=UPI002E345497|nr:hypothetical protein [Sphingomonas sp.]HEX4694266.1 hypothetical protein [Sphingomonas sp.]
MRIFYALLPAAMLAGAPTAAQTFRPAVVTTNLSPLESLCHVRVALNVAALGCRDADETTTVAEYNALIRGQSAELAAANAAVDARYKAQYGAGWQDARERDMTRLYNFFAQPAAQAQFCATAKTELARIAAVDTRDLEQFAVAELPALEAPFWSDSGAQFAGDPSPTAVVAISAAVPVAPGMQH